MSTSSALPPSHQVYVFLYTSSMWAMSPSVVVGWLHGQSGMYNCWFSRPSFVQRLLAPGYWGQVMKQLAMKTYRITGPILVSLTQNFFHITASSLSPRSGQLIERKEPNLGLLDLPSYSGLQALFHFERLLWYCGWIQVNLKRVSSYHTLWMFFEGLSGNALVSFAVKPLYFALFQVGCVWAEIPSCGCAWEYTLRGTPSPGRLCAFSPSGNVDLKIYLEKFRPPLPLLSPARFPFLSVLQYFCSSPLCSFLPAGLIVCRNG